MDPKGDSARFHKWKYEDKKDDKVNLNEKC